jgi:4-amino-4-deoxy-L-arabinose transferase-like glycosyltransferase
MDSEGSVEAFAAPPGIDADTTRWRWIAAAIVVLAALLFFARLGSRALWSSEFRWAEISREMIVSHNYFWPTINGKVYYDKPLGSYWLVVGATWVTGSMNEAAARIPSAVAGLIAVLLVIALGRRLYDLQTGAIAGFILATSFSFVFFSRHASADVETIAGELAAISLFLRNEDHQRRFWVIALWSIMAITSLTKGLLGFVLPLVVIGAYSCLVEGWNDLATNTLRGSFAKRLDWLAARNRWFFNWWTVVAVAIAGLIYYAPFAVSHAQTGSGRGLYMVYRENIERFFKPFDHRGPIYMYCYVIFALMAPWSAFLPSALFQMHSRLNRNSDHTRSDRFTLVFFWSTFVFFTLSGSRRSYYILPILPPAAMIVSRVLAGPHEALREWPKRLLIAGYCVIVAVVLVSGLALLPPGRFLPAPWNQLPMAPVRPMLAVYWIASLIAIGWSLRNLNPRRMMLASGIAAYAFMVYYFVFAMPAADAWRGEKNFALQVRQFTAGQTSELAFFRNEGPVFYLESPRPVPEYEKSADISAAVASGEVKWIVVRRRDLFALKIPLAVAVSEAVYPWDPKEHRLNAMVLVHVLRAS